MDSGFALVARPGNVVQINFPVVRQFEVSGIVQIKKNNSVRGLRNITLQLKKINGEIVATTKSEIDGFYYFPRVSPGEYLVEVQYDPITNSDFSFSTINKKVLITKLGLDQSTYDFIAVAK